MRVHVHIESTDGRIHRVAGGPSKVPPAFHAHVFSCANVLSANVRGKEGSASKKLRSLTLVPHNGGGIVPLSRSLARLFLALKPTGIY